MFSDRGLFPVLFVAEIILTRIQEFFRIAVGIGRPLMRDSGVVSDYVLSRFDPGEREKIMKYGFPVIPKLIQGLMDIKH